MAEIYDYEFFKSKSISIFIWFIFKLSRLFLFLVHFNSRTLLIKSFWILKCLVYIKYTEQMAKIIINLLLELHSPQHNKI